MEIVIQNVCHIAVFLGIIIPMGILPIMTLMDNLLIACETINKRIIKDTDYIA